MKMRIFMAIALMANLVSICSCGVCKHDAKKKSEAAQFTSPQAIIYTTKGDYSNLVPVILTPDKKGIASYSDIKDVYFKGVLAYPTALHNGYLLDNRGISENVAFIKLTYEQYAALPSTPSAEELTKMIVDKNPLEKMYSCGQRSKFVSIADELNSRIDKDDFSGFIRIK
jgi:hypothetical protein